MNGTILQKLKGAALCAVVSTAFLFPSVSSASVTVTTAPASVPNGETADIAATVIGASAVSNVTMLFSLSGSDVMGDGWNRQTMAASAGDPEVYTGFIPLLPAGTLSWYVRAEYVDGTSEVSVTNATTILAGMTYDRFHDMKRVNGTQSNVYFEPTYGWQQDKAVSGNNSTNFYANSPNGSQWLASGVGWASGAAQRSHIPPPTTSGNKAVGQDLTYPVIYFWNIDPEWKPFIRTPLLDGGLGTFSFDAHYVDGTSESRLAVQITRKANPDEGDWITIEEYSLPLTGTYYITNVVNDATVKYARIFRTKKLANGTYRVGFIGIDDICATLPPPNVTMKEYLIAPGYPAIGQDVTVRCVVSNINPRIPALNQAVTAFYRRVATADASVPGWLSTNLTYVGEAYGGSLFTGTIPAESEAGSMHYFFRCDFEGYCHVSPEHCGMQTPKYLYTADTGSTVPPVAAPPHCLYEVRSFLSRFSDVRVRQFVDGGGYADYDMSLVGDNQWQTTTPVEGSTVTRAYFYGRNCYFDGADAFSASSYFYGDRDQPEPYETPTGGRPERSYGTTNGLPAIRIDVAREGYLLYRLDDSVDDSALNYTIKRGVFQDFDDWVADADWYSKSLYGSSIVEHEESFDDWDMAYGWPPESTVGEDFTKDPPARDFDYDTAKTYSDWLLTNARIDFERVTNNVAAHPFYGITPYSNQVAQVRVGGKLQNSGYSPSAYTPGIGTLSCRMRSSVDDNFFAIYDNHGWEYLNADSQALLVETDFNIPGNCQTKSKYYVSVVVNYRDELNYHEVRYGRSDANDAYDRRAFVEIWRHVNGTAYRLNHWDTSSNDQVRNDGDITVKIRIKRTGASTRRANIAVGLKIGTWTVWGNYNAAVSDNIDSDLYLGGKIGFGAFECAPTIKRLSVSGGTGGAAYSFSSSSAPVQSDWNLGGVDTTRPNSTRWYFQGSTLYRRIPKIRVNVYTAEFTGAEDPPSVADRYALVDSVDVEELAFGTYSWDLHSWAPLYVKIGVANESGDPGEGYIVVDSVKISPWRAHSRNSEDWSGAVVPTGSSTDLQCYWWTSEDHQFRYLNANQLGWTILEGWAVTNAATHSVSARFERSQANTNLAQAVVSPLLTNGIGTVRFDYRVEGDGISQGRVVYALEYTESGNVRSWDNVAAVYTNNIGDTGFHSLEIGENYGEDSEARVRIRVLEGSTPDAVLWLDDVYVNDYPPEAVDMWKVYNGCITYNGFGDTSRIFGGAGKTLFLNDNPGVAGVDLPDRQEYPFDEHLPYLQAPRMEEGIGEVSFMYRAYSATKPGLIVIDVSSSETLADASWRNLTNIVVEGTGYVKFEDPMIYQTTNHFVRLHSVTNGVYGRVCIDNVLVTEPSRASYDISAVWLDPLQPVYSDSSNVTVCATITREMQHPTGIRLFVCWQASTNDWGYANWWASAKAHSVELYRDGEGSSTFRTAQGQGLPARPANGTVQYVVWGLHNDIPAEYEQTDVIFQKDESFTNPSWYGSVDLNAIHADCGFSPYYFVYSCAPGAVWINEVWSSYSSGSEYYPDSPQSPTTTYDKNNAYEFVELAGKSGVDISGWRVNTYKNSAVVQHTFVVPEGTTIPNDASGWGFYVFGDVGTPNVDQTEDINGASYTGGSSSKNFFWNNGRTPVGVELLRDSGIVEQRVFAAQGKTGIGSHPEAETFSWISQPWKSANTKGYSYALLDSPVYLTDEAKRYFNSGTYAPYTNDFVVVNGASKVWYWCPSYPTPGEVNYHYEKSVAQTFAPVISTSYLLTSSILSGAAYGTQNGVATPISIEVESGASTSIVYVAGNWYKITALTSNGVSVPAAVGQSSYTFEASNLAGDVANEVSFGPTTASDYASATDPAARWTDAILNWFRARGWSEDAIAAGDSDIYTVWDEYLLNTDPTVFTTVTNVIRSIAIDGDDITLRLGLTRLEGGTAITAPVNGAVAVYGAASLDDIVSPGWTRVGGTAVISAGTAFGATDVEELTFDNSSLGLRFFIWKLE